MAELAQSGQSPVRGSQCGLEVGPSQKPSHDPISQMKKPDEQDRETPHDQPDGDRAVSIVRPEVAQAAEPFLCACGESVDHGHGRIFSEW
jgi:hypothetical protein